jgi:D-alanyl-D-alanine dipeptidase
MGAPRLLIATELAPAGDGAATAAAVGVMTAERGGGHVAVVELGASARRRPTLLSSAPARKLEEHLRDAGFEQAAARGRICWVNLGADAEWTGDVRRLLAAAPEDSVVVAHLPPVRWRQALDDPQLEPRGALIRADVARRRHLVALCIRELRERGMDVRVAARPLGLVGGRRALAGLDPGGPASARMDRIARSLVPSPASPPTRQGESGQSLPLVVGSALVVIMVALALAALGGAVAGAARGQRGADLAALSAARSMRDDLPRLTAPARLPNGSPNPAHIPKPEYLRRAELAAREAAERNDVASRRVSVSFPDAEAVAPVRARVTLRGPKRLHAEAQAALPAGSSGAPAASASGGGYSGPLEYRQGKPMRPDVAAAFDRLAAAASRDGVHLLINSAFRSDAEQARLFAANPDPRWVAPPGTSLHRCGTELDLGPASAYPWLAANASRFGFRKRYSWEPWHFGFVAGPAPCSAGANRLGNAADGGSGAVGLPPYVPGPYRAPLARAAARWDVSATLLAAQLMAESGFDPTAVSPAGARGIAQFMPATAAAYGLRDPFDPNAAIDAQAHLMSDLLGQFGSTALALAAYNAGPAPVAACGCVPPYPETQAYVARILALAGGAGDLMPQLEVRLVD